MEFLASALSSTTSTRLGGRSIPHYCSHRACLGVALDRRGSIRFFTNSILSAPAVNNRQAAKCTYSKPGGAAYSDWRTDRQPLEKTRDYRRVAVRHVYRRTRSSVDRDAVQVPGFRAEKLRGA